MREMTMKELTLLGKDLNEAKIKVLHKHGFSCAEISNIMSIPESVARARINTSETGVK